MRMILTEKPSVASEFALALKADKRQGYYENQDTIITYCVGHLLRLYNPEDYDPSLKEWTIESLPIVPKEYRYTEITELKRQLATIKYLFKSRSPSPIIIATDAGREGEVIARETLRWCGKTDLSNVFRFWTSEALTEQSIDKNLRDLKPADKYSHVYLSGYYRQLGDWLIGMNFTRYFSVKLMSFFSFGRVQVPVLAALVERTEGIKGFTAKPFYNLRVTLAKNSPPFFAFYTKDGSIRFDNKNTLEPILSEMQKLSPTAKAVKIQKEQKLENPPQLYNLTALQKAANKAYGLKASQTADIAQSLYEKHKVLSYPRTSSRVLSRSDHALLCNTVTNLNFHYPDIFRGCTLPSADNAHIFDDAKLSDHHALLIFSKLPPTLTDDESHVATLVLKNMAALLLSPHIYNLQIADFDICGRTFQAKGTQVLNQGWKQLYESHDTGEQEPSKDEGQEKFDVALPPIAEGDVFDILYQDLLEKSTKPPAPFTEASLLGLMERNSLGTEATRADIIEKLLTRKYAFRSKRIIIATDKGSFFIHTVQTLPTEQVRHFTDLGETARWESMLDTDPTRFYSEISLSLQTSLATLRSLELQQYPKKPIGNCPHCNLPLRDGPYSYHCTNGCMFAIPHKLLEHTITEKEAIQILSGAPTHLCTFTSERNGAPFKAKLQYDPKTNRIVFVYPQPAKVGGRR